MDKYTVEIKLGNDAMTEAWQVAQALYALADAIADTGLAATDLPTRNIMDYNGNVVGYGAPNKGGVR